MPDEIPGFTVHDLGDGLRFLTGLLPAALVWDPAVVDEVWELHPEAKHVIHMPGGPVETPHWQQAYGADWRWEEGKHERVNLGRGVGSLAFSPDGKILAEGPAAGEHIEVRDVQTRKVVQTVATGSTGPMTVPRLAYAHGGRVLIACDTVTKSKPADVPHRIHLWDSLSGTVAHQIALRAGVPSGIDVSPNGRYLAVVVDEGEAGRKLRVWRLDGETPVEEPGPTPPAAVRPR